MTTNNSLTAPERLSDTQVRDFLLENLRGAHRRERVLVLVPDQTRTLPLPGLFSALTEALEDAARLDVLIALGTHPPLSLQQQLELLGLGGGRTDPGGPLVRVFNHAYDRPESLVRLGELSAQTVRELAGESWHASLDRPVPVTVNRRIEAYDRLLILGPVFPHEVVGFSGGWKYLFPGISGPEMINATHWLGALAGIPGTIGRRDTPVRRMIHRAAELVPVPVSLLAPVVVEGDLAGLFYGDPEQAWAEAADLSAQRHIRTASRRYPEVLSRAQPRYDELWTAAKAVYKVEQLVEDGGRLILYAPELAQISETHGGYLRRIGYHILPYFLQQWEIFREFPLAVLAHSTHLKGTGTYQAGREQPRIEVVLASRIPEALCREVNLAYRDPADLDPAAWQDQAPEDRLVIPHAGETLYRVED
jgi:nickel-dependent lactate racemase